MTETEKKAKEALVRCVELAAAEGKQPHEITKVIKREHGHDPIFEYEVNRQFVFWVAYELNGEK